MRFHAIGKRFVAIFILTALSIWPRLSYSEQIELKNGDKIEGKVIGETQDSIVIEHEDLGQLIVPRSALKPPAPPNPGLFGTDFLRGWNRSLGAGFSGSSGNSSDASLSTSLTLNREADRYRGAFDGAYFFANTSGTMSTNELYTNYKHDFLIGSKGLYLFLQGRYQYDQFQAWENRISGSGGIGYDIFSSEKFSLRSEIGLGFSKSFGSENQWLPEGALGVVMIWQVMQGQQLRFDTSYYPALSELPEFRMISNGLYSIALAGIDGLSLRIGFKNEYDSRQPGKNNNLKYFGNLVYDF